RVPNREPIAARPSGAGLGLPIARRLVDAQGGRIWLEAVPHGRGAMVVVLLPTAERGGSGAPGSPQEIRDNAPTQRRVVGGARTRQRSRLEWRREHPKVRDEWSSHGNNR